MNDKNRMNTPTLIYTVKEVSNILHTSPAYIYDLIKAGLLPAIKLGSYKVRLESLENFLKKNEGNDLSNPYSVIKIQNPPTV